MTGHGARCVGSMSRSPKPRRAVDGHAPVKRNRYIQLSGATKSVNRAVGGQDPRPGRVEGLHHQPHHGQSAEFVIDAYHQLWRIEKSFRMSKHDLQARPIYHHLRESIEAHLSIGAAWRMTTFRQVSHPAMIGKLWRVNSFARGWQRVVIRNVRYSSHGRPIDLDRTQAPGGRSSPRTAAANPQRAVGRADGRSTAPRRTH